MSRNCFARGVREKGNTQAEEAKQAKVQSRNNMEYHPASHALCCCIKQGLERGKK
jgi:hypothetical protein